MEFRLPELGEGVYEAEFVSWLVQAGDAVKSGQPLMEVLTDKATMEVPSPFAGKITELMLEPGQTVKVGDAVLRYQGAGKNDEAPAKKEKSAVSTVSKKRAVRNGNQRARSRVQAAPSVRLMARKMGVALESIEGTGPRGRILIEDLTQHLNHVDWRRSTPKERKPDLDVGKPGTTMQLIGLRGKIAEQMIRSKSTIPHYSYVDECDATDLVHLRESLKARFQDAGVRLTYLPFIVKAVTCALQEVPVVNATTDDETNEITLHDHYHVGVAVATPHGLIVPVIRDADRMSIVEIAREIERLSDDARRNRVQRGDLGGGTFTVTNVGNIGGLFSTPVINHPEVGILGIGKMVKRPAFDEHDNVVARHFSYLSLSFDHRVVDGAVGAHFTNVLIGHLHAPATLLVDALS